MCEWEFLEILDLRKPLHGHRAERRRVKRIDDPGLQRGEDISHCQGNRADPETLERGFRHLVAGPDPAFGFFEVRLCANSHVGEEMNETDIREAEQHISFRIKDGREAVEHFVVEQIDFLIGTQQQREVECTNFAGDLAHAE